MIAILDCRELKYRIQRKLNHRFGDDIKIKFEHDEAELMRDSQQCDILFIPDRLSLKSNSGYELCKKLHGKNPDCYVVVVGADHSEAYQGYLCGINNYIRADYVDEDLDRCLDSVEYIFRDKQYIDFKVIHSGAMKIDADDIIYVETSKRNTVIHTATKDYVSSMSISAMEQVLPTKYFIRTARSHIVNIHKIKEAKKTYILTCACNEHIPLSRSRKNNFMELWSKERRTDI